MISLAYYQYGHTRIDSIQWSENPVQGWVKGRKFPVIFHRQVFTNKDDSTELFI